MLTLPIPLVVALILGFLFVRHLIAADRSLPFLILLAACVIQALVISLTQHYGLSILTVIQPVTAVAAPPLAWFTFQSTALRPLDPKRDGVHLLGPAFTAFCTLFAPQTLDIVLPTIFAGYGIAILIRLRHEGALPLARLEAGPLPVRIWNAVGVLLILSALSDILITVALGLGYVDLRPLIISVFTSFTLFGIGLLSLSRNAEGAVEDKHGHAEPQYAPTEEDTALIARLDEFMEKDHPYLDPDLTLTRLARRLQVPVKQLSAAINRAKGENVSRLVNGYRIRHACEQLANGETVTSAMLNSGFNTKSNFNREFARVVGQSPSAFLRSKAISG
ncbi:MAG: AraC family transcriptional regulator [Kiloniellales bacterium]|nr:AraC family transcriptional regulator [Kiloniellales bacterium]